MGRILNRGSDSPDQRELLDEQQRGNLHTQNVTAAEEEAMARQGADALLDVVESDLDGEKLDRLRNLIANDIPLSQLTNAEVHEFRWLARAIEQAFLDMHPPEESAFQGEFRAAMSEDPRDAYEALDDAERLEISQIILAATMRATRAREGWQQRQWHSSYRISQVVDPDDEEPGGWLR